MKTMILDTSSNFLYLFLTNDNEKFEVIVEGKNKHSEQLMDLINEGLNKLNLEVKDLEKIICGIGPGSYTGLRVGVTVCKIFSWTCDIPLYTISSLDILGSGYLKQDGIYAICDTAKKDYLYAKVIEVEDSKIIVKKSDEFILKEEFINSLDSSVQIVNEENYKFDSDKIIEMAVNKVIDIHNLVPNYLRKANG